MKVVTTFRKKKDPKNPVPYAQRSISVSLQGPTPIVKELLKMIEWFFKKKALEGWSQS